MKRINRTFGGAGRLLLIAFALSSLSQMAQAQPFVYLDGDLCLGFRKAFPFSDNNQVVVNIGQASTYINAPIGTTLTISAFSASQLASPTFANLNDLSWSVFGWFTVSNANYQGYPAYTLWLTVPRSDNAVQSPAPHRYGATFQSVPKSKMASILLNAAFISHDMGSSSPYNTATFVRESVANYASHLYSVWMGNLTDGTGSTGTLNDTWPDNDLEVMTPDTFSGTVRNDLFEVRPLDDGHGHPVVDPHTGSTGLAYYVGYFEFSSSGTMTFTREVAATAPAQVTLSIARANNVSTISFPSSSSVTYKLFFTNSAGLGTPLTNWPSLPGTISGDGTTKSFQDTTTDPQRIYRVTGQ